MKLRFTFSDDTVIDSEFILEGAKITQNLYSNLKHADDTFQCRIPWNEDLHDKIIGDIDANVKAELLDDEDEPLFSGFLRKSASFTKTQRSQPFSIEILTQSVLFDIVYSNTVQHYQNQTLRTIITNLLSMTDFAGLIDLNAISATDSIRLFILNEGDNIKAVLDELLYEYGYCYRFDSEGNFHAFPLFSDISGTVTQEFNGTNTLNEIQQNIQERQYKKISVKYFPVVEASDVLIFEDTTGADDSHEANITIKPNSYYLNNESNFTEYDSKYRAVRWITSAQLETSFSNPGVIQSSFSNLGTKGELSILNNSSMSNAITKLKITGNGFFELEEAYQKTSYGIGAQQQIEAKYLQEDSYAARFAKKLLDYYKYANFQSTVISKTNYDLGSYVTLTGYGIGTVTAKIIRKTIDVQRNIFSYILESVTEYDPTDTSEKEVSVRGNSDAGTSLRTAISVLSQRVDNIVTDTTTCDASVKAVTLNVGPDGRTLAETRFDTEIYLRQGQYDLDFTLGQMVLPSGWSYQMNGRVLTFIVGEGVAVNTQTFLIPILYRTVVGSSTYVDENGETYIDENGEEYIEIQYAAGTTQFNISFLVVASGTEKYLGTVTNVQDIPAGNVGDYFVWAGANHTVTTLSQTGEFLQGRTYKYIGLGKAWKYEQDKDSLHNQIVLSDVLGIANADLEHNNSTVYEYLDHLTSNSIYTGFLVANQAFINNLASKLIEAELVTTEYLEANYTKTSELTASLIKVGTGTLDNTLNDIDNEFGSVDTALSGKASNTALNNVINGTTAVDIKNAKVNGNTLIQGGYIKTEFIDVDTILGNNAVFRGTIQVGDYSATTSKGAKLYTANGDGYLDVTNLRANSIANRVKDINGVRYFSIYTERLFFNGIFAHDTIKKWNWKNSQSIDAAYFLLEEICNRAGEGNYIQPLSCSFDYPYLGNTVHVTGKLIRFIKQQGLTSQGDKIIAILYSELGIHVDSYTVDPNSHIICRSDFEGNLLTTNPVTAFSTVIV